MSKFSVAEVRFGQRRHGPTRQMFNDVVDAVRANRWVVGRAGVKIAQLEQSLPDVKRAVVLMEQGRMPADFQVGVVSALAEGRLALRKVKAARMASRQHPERSNLYRQQSVYHLLKANRMFQ